jgi:hypothetical protein
MRTVRESRTDRIVLVVAVFAALAVLALAVGPGAEFADQLLGNVGKKVMAGVEWLGDHKKEVNAVTSIVGGVVAIAGLFL